MAEYGFAVDRSAIMLIASAIGETHPVDWDEDACGGDQGVVDIEVVTRMQRGEPVVSGSARAVLPARR